MSTPASLDYEDLKINLDEIEWNYVCIRTHEGEIIHTKYASDDSVSQDSVILWHPVRLQMIETEEGSYKTGFGHYEYFSDDVIFYLHKESIRMISSLSEEWIKNYVQIMPKLYSRTDEPDNETFDGTSIGGTHTLH